MRPMFLINPLYRWKGTWHEQLALMIGYLVLVVGVPGALWYLGHFVYHIFRPFWCEVHPQAVPWHLFF